MTRLISTLWIAFTLIMAHASAWAGRAAPKSDRWIAFVAKQVNMAPPTDAALSQAPAVIVCEDGKVLWQDELAAEQAGRENRERWRIGQADPAALAAFAAEYRVSPFFTLPAQPEEGAAPPSGNDVTTTVGVRVNGNARVVGQRNLDLRAADRADTDLAAAAAMALNEIEKLIPAKSARYTPEKIRVEILPANPGPDDRPWPIDESLAAGERGYSGKLARTVIYALAVSNHVTEGGKTYLAVWIPDIDVSPAP